MSVVPIHPMNGNRPDIDIPDFEGKKVSRTTMRFTSASGLDITDFVLRPDALLNLQVEARVVGVNHVIDEKTGELVRQHTAKIIEANFMPWDASNPSDKGVAQ